MTFTWDRIARDKRESVLAKIPEQWVLANPPNEEVRDVTGTFIHQYLSPFEVEITETDAVGIAEKTASGTWKALDVAKAFCHRAALAHQLVHCLHEIFFDDAYEQARHLDEHLAKTGTPVGPLHGVPVSLKDQFHVKGLETSMGYVGWLGTFQGEKGSCNEKQFESLMVGELRDSGAILYCKTSVPHTLMAGETVNNIIGYTWNPKNRNLSSGGSSGGEGALIGMRGSPLGFGTDIGGSIRIPAGFNGLFGLRPSTGRLPYEGMANSMDGQNTVLSVVGPLASSARSLRLATKTILATKPWLHDPLVVEMPWRKEQEQRVLDVASGKGGTLSFGVLRHDGSVTPHPPVSRAVEELVRKIKALGHEVIEWKPPSHKTLHSAGMKAYNYDDGVDVHQAFSLSGEPPSEQVRPFCGSGQRQPRDATHIAETNRQVRALRKEHMEYWNGTASQTTSGEPVDAFIMPLAPFAAARPNSFKYLAYSAIVNFLDYTAITIPVTQVDKTLDLPIADYQPLSEQDGHVQSLYDAEIYDGAHVSVQLVGRRLQEEKMVALAEYLDSKTARP